MAAPRPYTFKEGRGQVICCLHTQCVSFQWTWILQMASRTICYGLGVISCLCMKDALPNRCSAVFVGNPSTSCTRSQLTHDHVCIHVCICQPRHVLDHHCSLCVLAHLAMLVCTNGQLIMGIVLQAYHALADFLIKQGTMSASKHIITHPPQQL